ncbi:MAG TPA: maleylpyruvate isomerase N-terminal domain-containing protein, partial [Streptosporangiaceae bacterium]
MSAAGRDQAPLPADLRERVLAASLLARGAGQTVPAVPQISADEAFARAADAFYGLLGALSDEGWKTEALRGLDVQGLVGHMIGVEHDTHRALAGDPAVADAEHVESTQAWAVRQADRSPDLTRDEWRRAAEITLELARAADGAQEVRLAVHGMRLPLSDLLVVRAFELWVHDN